MTLDPFDNPLLWDKLTLEGGAGRFTLPGIVKISYELGLIEDSAPVLNQNGKEAGLQKTLLGYKPATFDVVIQVWTAAQFKELGRILEIFRPKNNNAPPKAILAIHPQIQLLGVKNVYITSVSGDGYSPKDGYFMRLKLEQWFAKTTGELIKDDPKPKLKPKTTKPVERSSSGAIPLDATGKPTAATPSGNDWKKTYVPPSTNTPGPK